MNKSLHMGVGARNGLTAAYLAQMGYGSGVLTILEPPYSIFQAFIPDAAKPEQMTKELGERWDILDTGFKKYSAGRPIHAAIASVIKVVDENQLKAHDIERIVVKLPTLEHGLLSGSKTLNVNIEYIVAVAAMDEEVAWEQFDDAHQKDPVLQALWKRVTSVGDPELDAIKESGIGARPAGIELSTYDGRHFSERMLFPPGHPDNPLTSDELEGKFRYWSTRVISESQADRLLDKINHLDELSDINEIGDLLRV
jgi:2-methylcitrate dehydratase PrpD